MLALLDEINDTTDNPLQQNSWYNYATIVAQSVNETDCYVCSYIPISSTQPTLWARPFSYGVTDCIVQAMYVTMTGEDHVYMSKAYSGWNGSHWGKIYDLCSQLVTLTRIKASALVAKTVIIPHRIKFPICYYQEGNVSVGRLTAKRCVETRLNVGECIQVNTTKSETLYCGKWAQDRPSCPTDHNCFRIVKLWLPARNGTWPVDDVFWVCGTRLYLNLPPGWDGICAPTQVSDHTFVVAAEPKRPERVRQNLDNVEIHQVKHIWQSNDVPEEFKIWKDWERGGLSMLPWLGIPNLQFLLETVNYRLAVFLNASLVVNKAQNKMLTEIRTMVLQNRLVLDLLTAAQGGVCGMINATCCTYISDGINSDSAQQAMRVLEKMQTTMTTEFHETAARWSLWGWFTSGSW
ncbi:uncharacterized protein LOC117504838 [Thalassophryne amazonica]|uniref:uncharacterized protein LOC117504838 n=1 Tax=Thalassophryne amazonica TaxID=390379 RepID=UPI0014717BB7|nr:uncharacterized protein LOC117504838 [Thalassophryne amazonica]